MNSFTSYAYATVAAHVIGVELNTVHVYSYFEGLGRENPSKVRKRQEEEKRKQEEASEERNENDDKELRRRKGAEKRDKESKDEGRSWLARLGLMG